MLKPFLNHHFTLYLGHSSFLASVILRESASICHDYCVSAFTLSQHRKAKSLAFLQTSSAACQLVGHNSEHDVRGLSLQSIHLSIEWGSRGGHTIKHFYRKTGPLPAMHPPLLQVSFTCNVVNCCLKRQVLCD